MKQTFPLYLQQNLKKLLSERDLSIHQLSRKTNINKSTLHNYLSGVNPQGIQTLLKLASFFEVSLEQLLFSPDHHLQIKNQVARFTEGHFEITIKKMD